MAERELLLHIGTHKTGTTSFQRAMLRNEALLLQRGVLPVSEEKVPSGTGSDFNLRGFAHHFLRPELVTGVRLSGKAPERSLDQRVEYENALVDMINCSTADKVIMSTEALCFMRTPEERERLRAFLTRIERRIRAVVVFRCDAKWRESWRAQCLRHPGLAPLLDDLPEQLRIEGAWYYDKQAVRDFWRGLADLDEIEYREGEDMTPVLFERMGISAEGLRKVHWLNPTQKPART